MFCCATYEVTDASSTSTTSRGNIPTPPKKRYDASGQNSTRIRPQWSRYTHTLDNGCGTAAYVRRYSSQITQHVMMA